MADYDFNPGILIGGAAAALAIFAALAALYLWAVNRARQRLDPTATPQERAVVPWLSPLVLPVLVILCLGLVAHLAKAYEQKSWPQASYIFINVMILMFWLKIRKKTKAAHTKGIAMTNMRYSTRRCILFSSLVATLLRLFEISVLWLGIAAIATAANRTWIGGNADWDGTNGNWSGNDEPDSNDVAIFNTSNTVDLVNAVEELLGLTMSGGISLSVNESNVLSVNGTIELSDASTDLVVEAGAIVIADVMTINSGAEVTLRDGSLWIIDQSGVGLLDVNNGGELSGNGLILLDESVSAGTQVFNLDGTLTAHSTDGFDVLSLAFATLTITVSDSDGVIDLDGNDENSTINVLRNDTLLLNGGVLESAYSGTMNLSAGATFSRDEQWAFNGTLNTTASGTAATIDGGDFTQAGGSINIDAAETLRISSSGFTTTNGTINNSGHIIFDTTTDTDSTNISGITFNMTGPTASLTVNPGVRASITSNDIELDGAGTATNVVTIGSLAKLDLSLSGAADEIFTGHVILDRGTLEVITSDNDWSLGGTLSVIGSGAPASLIDGERVTFSANTTIAAGAALAINAPTIYDGSLAVAGGGLLIQNTAATANGTPTIEVESFRANAPVTVSPGATLLVDVGHINDPSDAHDNAFEIDSGTLDISVADGEWQLGTAGGASGTIYFRRSGITPTLEGASTLRVAQGTIDVDGGATIFVPIILEQTTSSYGTLRFVGEGGLASTAGHLQLRGGDIHDITDDPSVNTELHLIGGLTVSSTAASGVFVDTFRWDLSPTTIGPGAYFGVYADNIEPTGPQMHDNLITINQGTLHVDLGNHASWIMNGYLDLNAGTVGGLNEVKPGGDTLEIGDDAGTDVTLNVGAPGTSYINSFVQFNSDAYVYIESGAELVMNGGVYFAPVNGANNGVFTGGAGTWLFLGPVTFAEATTIYMPEAYLALGAPGDSNNAIVTPVTMSLETMGNFNGLMTISAPGRLTVNLTDPNGEWTIGSTATINSLGNSPSDILLAGSDINHNGTMNVNGESQIAARLDIGSTGEINIIDADGSLTLSGGSLADPNTISGGEVNGPGQLIIAPQTALGGNGTITALINQGILAPGASPGQITLDVYTQTQTGVLEIELGGTGPNDIDRLAILGEASLAGTLNLSLINGFVPSAGQTFDILAAAGGVTGTFDTINLPTLPLGLSWVFNDDDPTMLQLSVIGNLPGDFNLDGAVDAADYVVWRKTGGTPEGYDTWRVNFGATADGAAAVALSGATGSASAAVPEPASLILLATVVVAATLRRRRFGIACLHLLLIALVCSAVVGPASPATAAPVFTAVAEIGNLGCFRCGDQKAIESNDRPVEAEATGEFNGGQVEARAKAGPGFLEAFGSAENQGPQVNPTVFSARAIHEVDDLFFSSPPGSTVEEIPTRLNLHLEGVFGFDAANDDLQKAFVQVEQTGYASSNNLGWIEIIRRDGSTTDINRDLLLANVPVVEESDPSGNFARSIRIDANISIPLVVPMNEPLAIGFSIAVGGEQWSTLGRGSVTADFGHTLRFPTDRPVFDLPAGFTANSASFGIVDNQYVVPEPAAAVLLLGLAVIGALGRQRRISLATRSSDLAIPIFGLKLRKKRNLGVATDMSGNTHRVSERRTMGTRYGMVTHLVVAALSSLFVARAGPWLALPATAANYHFIKVVDNSGPFNLIGASSISSSGTVAFVAAHNDLGSGIFTGSGGTITAIADISGPFSDFVGFPTINAGGTVAFHAVLDAGGTGIFTGRGGGPITTIADASGPFSGFAPGGNHTSPAINAGGAVAFRAGLDAGGEGIFVGSGGPTTTIADSSGPFNAFEQLPDLNAAGTAVFRATYDGGGQGIFTGSGGPTTTIADSSGPFDILLGPAINDDGEVAFATVFDDHFRPNMHFGVIKGSGGATTTVADLGFPPFSNLRAPVSINSEGMIVLRADLNNTNPEQPGIFTGPDPVADKVVAFGDPLFGSTVVYYSLGFTYRSLSDNGDVAFGYGLQNGESGIAIARLIPEPSSAILVAVGLLGAWGSRCRRHAWKHASN